MPNGQTVQRELLLYSLSTGNVTCFACKLFGNKTSAFSEGCSDWAHATARLHSHESSQEHRACMLKLMKKATGTGAVDSAIIKQG